ncbi:hypothetical protein AGMMS50256_33940 [Betaproteobacteria bacterium]|nr:hypothetical protein AGMMS50256_33940 [Betaproteobacteria bacterium]
MNVMSHETLADHVRAEIERQVQKKLTLFYDPGVQQQMGVLDTLMSTLLARNLRVFEQVIWHVEDYAMTPSAHFILHVHLPAESWQEIIASIAELKEAKLDTESGFRLFLNHSFGKIVTSEVVIHLEHFGPEDRRQKTEDSSVTGGKAAASTLASSISSLSSGPGD